MIDIIKSLGEIKGAQVNSAARINKVSNYFATGIYGMCASKAFLETKLQITKCYARQGEIYMSYKFKRGIKIQDHPINIRNLVSRVSGKSLK